MPSKERNETYTYHSHAICQWLTHLFPRQTWELYSIDLGHQSRRGHIGSFARDPETQRTRFCAFQIVYRDTRAVVS